jgi:hypothetical protein
MAAHPTEQPTNRPTHLPGKTTLLRALAGHEIRGIPPNCQVRWLWGVEAFESLQIFNF